MGTTGRIYKDKIHVNESLFHTCHPIIHMMGWAHVTRLQPVSCLCQHNVKLLRNKYARCYIGQQGITPQNCTVSCASLAWQIVQYTHGTAAGIALPPQLWYNYCTHNLESPAVQLRNNILAYTVFGGNWTSYFWNWNCQNLRSGWWDPGVVI